MNYCQYMTVWSHYFWLNETFHVKNRNITIVNIMLCTRSILIVKYWPNMWCISSNQEQLFQTKSHVKIMSWWSISNLSGPQNVIFTSSEVNNCIVNTYQLVLYPECCYHYKVFPRFSIFSPISMCKSLHRLSLCPNSQEKPKKQSERYKKHTYNCK